MRIRWPKFVPFLAKYGQAEDGTWWGSYGRSSSRRGSFMISGCDDELDARRRLKKFVLWDEDPVKVAKLDQMLREAGLT